MNLCYFPAGALGGGTALRVLGPDNPGRLAVGRAGGAAVLTAALGLAAAPADTPRFNGAARRLLVEGARVNLCQGAASIGLEPWVATGMAARAPAASPNGAAEAALLTETTGSSANNYGSAYVNFTAGVTYAASIFAKAGTCPTIQLSFLAAAFGGQQYANFDLAAGQVGTLGTTVSNARIEALRDGWFRCVMVLTATATAAARLYVAMTPSASATRLPTYAGSGRTVLVWGAQIEEAAFASSPVMPVPGTTTTAAREADVPLWQPPGGFGPQGTVVVRAMLPQLAPFGASQGLWQIDDGTDQNRIQLRNSSAGSAITGVVDLGGANLATLSAGNMVPGTPFQAAFAWAPGDQALCLNGGEAQTAAATLPAGLTRMLVGHASVQLSRAAHGEVELVDYRPARLPNALLQALTRAA
jgi:hypothetical protein